jgi:ChaB
MLRSRRYSRAGHELPATLRRSCQEAQDTFTAARDSAVQVYGETDQADRAAFTVLKEKFEKRGDHWIAKRDPAG